MKTHNLLVGVSLLAASLMVSAADYTYDDISKRYSSVQLSASTTESSKMQGECLVGLKDLNFKKKNTFDPVAEWGNYRSLSLLEQFPPCEVLIMMEVAQGKLKTRQNK